MKDKSVLPIEKQLNKFLQPKCLIPGGLGLWEIYFRKICAAWGEINGEIDHSISYFLPIMVVIWKAMLGITTR